MARTATTTTATTRTATTGTRPARARATARAAVGAAAATVLAVGIGAGPAAACGFLVAPNGAVDLLRTTTLASWENGVEHYVTSFEFSSEQPSFGSIIPLPSEPTTVERAGDWTLQRLRREIEPVSTATSAAAAAAAPAADKAEVLRQVQIDSLDVTVLRGGGAAVAEWANRNGFDLGADVTASLEHYATLSPYFMAAKFDSARAGASNFRSGDGIPIHLELPLDRPWVPLEILGAAKTADETVQADVFLLTPGKPRFGRFDDGVTVERSGPAASGLLDDLRSDKNSSWIPDHAYLTHVAIDTTAAKLTRDLVPIVAPVPSAPLPDTEPAAPTAVRTTVPWAVAAGLGGLLVGGLITALAGRSTRRRGATAAAAVDRVPNLAAR